ncbi:MAG: AAA-like domain-containing protein, partial [Bacteroidia bacterium]|nr:AAA-like domain-containing protein [Bacteroidia bacterium]
MKKRFNITGTCYPDQHYMMDNRAKLADVLRMVEDGEYFIINRPRQYGKTTTLFALHRILAQKEEYLPIRLDFQGVDEKWHASDEAFARMFVRQIQDFLEFRSPDLHTFLESQKSEVTDMGGLSRLLTRLAHKTAQKLVLLIDEVDASSNYEPFLRFLGMLRNKYLDRFSPQNFTFHSVVLAGVHDIKSLKLKVRGDNEPQYNSPWNIATDFKVDMSFHPHEIAPMLEDYAQAEKVEIPVEIFSDKLYYYTAGYPFLVAKLCKTLAEDILPKKTDRSWTLDDLETSVQLLLRENNTLFDSLIKNLENHSNLYDLTYSILVNGVRVPFDPHEPTISLGRLYGVFKENGTVKIHNRVYE